MNELYLIETDPSSHQKINPFIVCRIKKRSGSKSYVIFFENRLDFSRLNYCNFAPSDQVIFTLALFLWIALLSLKCSFRRDEKWKVQFLLLSFIKRQKAIAIKRYTSSLWYFLMQFVLSSHLQYIYPINFWHQAHNIDSYSIFFHVDCRTFQKMWFY